MAFRLLVAGVVMAVAPVVGVLDAARVAAVDDPRLAALSVSAGAVSPGFDPMVTSYSVSTTAASTTVSATPTTGGAPMLLSLDGVFVQGLAADVPSAPLALHAGANVITVRVVAVDNENVFRDYTVTVTPIPPTVGFVSAGSTAGVGQLYQALLASTNATGATVDHGDGTVESLALGPDGGFGITHVYVQEGTFIVTVAVAGPGGTAFVQQQVDVFLAGPTASDSVFVPPGGSGEAGIGGVTATLFHSGSGTGTAYLVVAALPPDVAAAIGAPAGALLFDIRVLGAGAGDTLTVTFTYPGDGIPALVFFDPVTRTFQRVVPSQSTVDAATHTATIVLDAASTPAVTSLRGTIFAPTSDAVPAVPVPGQPTLTG